MFAIIQTGGKQYLVEEGQTLKVEKLEKADGEKIEFEALLVSDDEGKDTKVGTPFVPNAKVAASVVETAKGPKITIIKYKPKSKYRRKTGHRQPYTAIKIEKITA
ncbi:50S ribosomal protein L21 [Candidatus Uhrbacteria bacterium]|nr:50S ribosomal protein L21 [Candidatus Uhrbacteria bacterium]MBT7717652.1 50S ribosomal protein L21 [Candidatus Uhrbacteria bacterium]